DDVEDRLENRRRLVAEHAPLNEDDVAPERGHDLEQPARSDDAVPVDGRTQASPMSRPVEQAVQRRPRGDEKLGLDAVLHEIAAWAIAEEPGCRVAARQHPEEGDAKGT